MSSSTVNTLAKYTIAGKTGANKALTAGSSTITVTLPANTTVPTSIAASNITVATTTPTALTVAPTISGRTITMTTPIAIAGNTSFTVVIGATTNVLTNPSQPGSYTYTIATSAETAGTTSAAYSITASTTTQVSAATVTTTSSQTSTASGYTVAFNVGSAGRLDTAATAGANTIAVTFPTGTTLPASIAASNVTVNGTPCTVAPSISGQTVTVTTPVAVANSGSVSVAFSSAAAITNPASGGSYTVTVKTSAETTATTSNSYSIVAPSALNVTGNYPIASGSYTDTATGIVMQRAQVQASAGTVALNSLTLNNSCTATSIGNARVYISSTSSNSALPGDAVLLGQTSSPWNGASTAVGLTGGTLTDRTVGTTARYIYIVYDMAAGQAGKSVNSTITSVGVASPGVSATGLSLSSNTLSVTTSINTLTVSGNTPIASGTRSDTDNGVLMQRVTLQGSGTLEVTSLTMNKVGTTSVIENVDIYISTTSATTLPPIDANTVKVGNLTNWNGNSTTIDLTAIGGTQAGRTLAGTTPKYLYVLYDMSQGQAGTTVGSQITAVGVASPNVGATGLSNFTSNTLTLSYSGDYATVANNTAVATSAKDSDAAVLMQHFQVVCNNVADGVMQLNNIKLQDNGTAQAIGGVKIYIDTVEQATLPSTAKQIGSLGQWNKLSTTIPLVTDFGATPADLTIAAGTPKYIYVVYTMYYADDALYVDGQTVQSQVTSLGVYTPDYGLNGLSLQSNNSTLSRGTWSKITSCGGCHNTAVSGPTALRDGTSRNNPVGTFPGTHNVHLDGGITCTRCHPDNTQNGYHHANGNVDIAGDLAGKYSKGDSFKVSNSPTYGTCSVSCHTNGLSSGDPNYAQGATVAWGAPSSSTCGSCHGVLAATPPASATHAKHVGQGSGYLQPCVRCHSTVVAATANSTTAPAIINNVLHARYTSGALKAPVVAYDSVNTGASDYTQGASCSTTYCHSKGKTVYAPYSTPLNTTFTWASPAGTLGCTGCHDTKKVNSTGTLLTGKHDKHMNPVNNPMIGTGNGFNCSNCHALTITNSDNATITNAANHVNKFVDYSGVMAGGSSRYSTATKSCNNVYCHSNGNPGHVVYVNMSGSKVWTGKTYSITTCNKCHGRSNNLGYPDYTNGGAYPNVDANSHSKHAAAAGFTDTTGCANCHIKTVDRMYGNQFRPYSTMHLNGSPTLAFKQIGTKTGAFNGDGTCSNTYCHGTVSPAWGSGSLLCDSCHNASKALAGAHMLHYSSATLPGAYADAPGNVSSATAYRFACSSCHSPDKGADHAGGPAVAGNGYGDAEIFFGYTSATRKGAYNYGTSSSTDSKGFKWSVNGGNVNGNCNSTYCHSNGQGGNGLTAVSWSTTTHAVGCVACHDTKQTGGTPTALSGKHDKHMNPSSAGSILGTGNGLNCVDCHAKTVNGTSTAIADKSKHVNKFADFSSVRGGGSVRFDATAKSCTNVYCHSNGNMGAIAFVAMTSSKVWTGSSYSIACNKCHGRSTTLGNPDYANGGASTATSNLHTGHLAWQASPTTTACADCHRRTVDPNQVSKFRPYSTQHLNGAVNISFNSTKTYIGSRATVSQGGYTVTCSQLNCHGSGVKTWGQTSGASATCQKCHGSATVAFATVTSAQVAPGGSDGTGRDTAGNTAATSTRVGAHKAHLTSVISAPIKCTSCHVKVMAPSDASHWNYSTATITFQGLAVANSKSPSDTRNASGVITCSNTYCHTAKYVSGTAGSMTPVWNSTTVFNDTGNQVGDCTGCHAMPPQGYSGHPAPLSNTAQLSTIYSTCGGCHANLASSGVSNVTTVFVDKTLHINGTINALSGCNACHGFDTTDAGTTWNPALSGGSGAGAHVKHINFIKSRLGIAALTPSSGSFGAGEAAAICGTCHTNTLSQHQDGTREIVFGAGGTTYTMGAGYAGSMSLLFGSSNPSFNTTGKTCSNISCHFSTPPSWY